jgi:hypothetical protein
MSEFDIVDMNFHLFDLWIFVIFMETFYIDDIEQFIERLRKIKYTAIFRGQSDEAWHLVPSVFRPLRELLTRASRQAASVGEAEEYSKTEQKMLEQFKRASIPYLSRVPPHEDNWQWLALARHYGLPTRLLDWTEYAAVAVFFAVEILDNYGKNSAVWVAQVPPEYPRDKDPFGIDQIYLYRPPHIATRITVQRSCFTVHPKNYLTYDYIWPVLEKWVIPSRSRGSFRDDLKKLGVTKSVLFPEPDAIAREIGFENKFPE